MTIGAKGSPQGCPAAGPTEGTWRDSWRALETLFSQGKVRAIGVSNFDVARLEELRRMATVPIGIVQNYYSPMHDDTAVRQWCARYGVVYQAYSSLGSQEGYVNDQGSWINPVLSSPVVSRTAAAVAARVRQRDEGGDTAGGDTAGGDGGNSTEMTPAQAVLCWSIQRGTAVIPRSSQTARIQANAALATGWGWWAVEPGSVVKERDRWGGRPDSGACEDHHEKCDEWATAGECSNNPGWMLKHCQDSCQVCASKGGQAAAAAAATTAATTTTTTTTMPETARPLPLIPLPARILPVPKLPGAQEHGGSLSCSQLPPVSCALSLSDLRAVDSLGMR